MNALNRIQKKLAELERKGLLEQFLLDYQFKPYTEVVRNYHVGFLFSYEVRNYIEETYHIKHVNQNQKKKQR